MQSPQGPAEGRTVAQGLRPQYPVDRPQTSGTNMSMAQRLEVLENTIQRQEEEYQAKTRTAMDEERLARLEKAVLRQTAEEPPSTTSTEPELSQSTLVGGKTPSNDGSKRRGSSFRARLFRRPLGSPGSVN